MGLEFFKETKPGDDAGYVGIRKLGMRVPRAALAEAWRLITNAERDRPKIHAAKLEEAIETTDFPGLFAVILDHQLLARFRAATMDFWPFTQRLTFTSFNDTTIHRLDGLSEPLEEIGENGDYQTSEMATFAQTAKATKKGRVVEISWEAIVNDGLGAFNGLADRLADAAVNTDQYGATALYCSATGPSTSLFGDTISWDSKSITNLEDLSISIDNIGVIAGLMAKQKDPTTGLRLRIRGVHIVVPMTMEIAARDALMSTAKMYVDGSSGVAYPMTSSLPQMGYQLHVNPWLDYIDESGNVDKTWYMFADAGQMPAIGWGYLVGHEGPEICMRSSNKIAIGGGGLIGSLSGSFEDDTAAYRVRVANGGARLNALSCFASVGS